MVLPGTDWKNQDRHIFDWLLILTTGVLVVLYLYHGVTGERELFLALAAFFIGWSIVYFTPYWQPVLYLLMAVIVGVITIIWLWEGAWTQALVLAGIGFNLVFIGLCVYLFNYEEPTLPPLKPQQ